MKKLVLFFAAIVAVSVASCGNNADAEKAKQDSIRIADSIAVADSIESIEQARTADSIRIAADSIRIADSIAAATPAKKK